VSVPWTGTSVVRFSGTGFLFCFVCFAWKAQIHVRRQTARWLAPKRVLMLLRCGIL
jgi:hypothetical protein